ncbi:MAG: hypothetical protein KDC38_03870 [Planctomycetes bacterium]|nr:hypothetical protein [Planctomycetota bacterium]
MSRDVSRPSASSSIVRRVVAGILFATLAASSGCRLHVERIEDGSGWADPSVDAIRVGVDGRTEILARFGPPHRLEYTETTEILEYRRGVHRGSDLTFLLPTQANPITSAANGIRSFLAFFFPEHDENPEFDREGRTERLAKAFVDFLFSFTPLSVSAEDSLTLHNRRLRYDVLRWILDREDHCVIEMELRRDVDSEALIRSSLLIE